ncbi:DNA-binding MarR family transcriptional regulator [Lactobacillus colini]|uniref:DNA-binding MarR family transcriptional regulator n=1 Tax=Lactobacillus colini TaxID=1819254 RepID=A0ABS4MCW7_9LACO|nr:MarR family transcriptional regulator [Lactobacillus colini]MBP2057534.1 DNA-binding MarR family transcriptional regulator [Lactobacillus colini]
MTTKSEKFNQMNQQLRLYMRNSHHLAVKYLADLNLTPQQARTLEFIKQNPGSIQRELADFFHLRGASVANMVKNLERDGLILRKNDPISARIKRIYITEKGAKIVEKIFQIFQTTSNQVTKDFPTEKIDQLTNLLSDLNHHLEKIIK